MINKENLILNDDEILRRRAEFPLLASQPELIYFDNAATTQKPQCVLDAITQFYRHTNANPLRGMYDLAASATTALETARNTIAKFLHATPEEIILTPGATAGLNYLALALTSKYAGKTQTTDEILISRLEHHSNLLIWQRAARDLGCRLVYADPDVNGTLTPQIIASYLGAHTKIVAITGMSNVLGQSIDVDAIGKLVHQAGADFIIDAAQLAAHQELDVAHLNIDALAFSGHKLFGPMGSGVLYLRRSFATTLEPAFLGGEMIATVTENGYTPAPLPHTWEAGTVNAAGSVGLAAALNYLTNLGWHAICQREEYLTQHLITGLKQIPHLHILGDQNATTHHALVSFVLDDVHAHDVATVLASRHIAVRAGQHCAALAHEFFHVPASTRASLTWYNTPQEIDTFLDELSQVRRKLGYDR